MGGLTLSVTPTCCGNPGSWGWLEEAWPLCAGCGGALSHTFGGLKCPLLTLGTSASLSVTWEPTGDGKRVISLADNHILLWDLQESSSQAAVSGES